jgi:ubiquinone/menaquinone biosynthesis C-methylase UbiE
MHTNDSPEGNSYGKQEAHRSGPSSFGMHDTDFVFEKLDLKPGGVFLDLGCGPGDYAMYASLIVGETGMVYAIDKWERMVTGICTEAAMMGYANVCSVLADICAPLPLGDASVDVCLFATVMHTLNMARDGSAVFGEVRRVLKPAGRLAIINCKKEDQPFGPPIEKRFSPQETEKLVVPCGFRTLEQVDLGYNYLIQFRIDESRQNH